MIAVCLTGPPSAGKTAPRTALECKGFVSAPCYELLRKRMDVDTEFHAIADQIIANGDFLPDDMVIEVMNDFLQTVPASQNIVIDGFPRTKGQAEWILSYFKQLGYDYYFFVIDTNDDECRVRNRCRIAEMEKLGKRRSDSDELTMTNRLARYHANEGPLQTFLLDEAYNSFFLVDGNGTKSSIVQEVTTIAVRQQVSV